MKTFPHHIFRMLAALSLLIAAPVSAQAQTFTNLHNFAPAYTNSVLGLSTNTDGGFLYARLVVSSNTLYGMTTSFNTNGLGGMFKINADGTGFTNFLGFGFINGNKTNGADEATPYGGLILVGNTFYGTTSGGGGTNLTGSVFSMKMDGSGLTTLHIFGKLTSNTNGDGAYPRAGVVLSGGMLYGTTYGGGTRGYGTVFGVSTNGTGFTNLHNFNGTNGAVAYGGVVASGNTLYGTAYYGGGAASNGTVFALNTDGSGFTNLHNFTALSSPYQTNSDGANPQAGLTLSGSTLYGAAARGGASGVSGFGTLFSLNTDGTGFTNLHNFTGTGGSFPYGDLLLTNNVLYGTTSGGGSKHAGTVFKINADGTGITELYGFPPATYNGSTSFTNSTGQGPWAGVALAGNALYGVTPNGGLGGNGVVYIVTLPAVATLVPIPLNATPGAGIVTLSWTNAAFSLQAAPNPTGTFTNLPGAASPFPVSTTNAQEFFRLQAN